MKRFLKRVHSGRELFLLALPAVIFVFIFSYIPLYGVLIPFKEFNYQLGLLKSPWVGWRNFEYLFNSNDAWNTTRNTVVLNTLFISTTTALGVLLALLLQSLRRGQVKFYQTILFFPYFVSWVVASYALLGFLDMERGAVNGFLDLLGISPVLWYNEADPWTAILTIANAWKNTGYLAVIYYAGLLSIDQELYEAAEIDGANRHQQVFSISIPMIIPLISVMVLLQIGKIFVGNFDMIYNLTRDSAMLYARTDVIDTYVYRALRQTGDIGMATAAGLYQATIGFVIVMAANTWIRKINPENSLF